MWAVVALSDSESLNFVSRCVRSSQLHRPLRSSVFRDGDVNHIRPREAHPVRRTRCGVRQGSHRSMFVITTSHDYSGALRSSLRVARVHPCGAGHTRG